MFWDYVGIITIRHVSQDIWVFLNLRINFYMPERDASERIAALDPNHQVIDIGLTLPTYC